MGELRGDLNFPLEPFGSDDAGHFRMEHLDRDGPAIAAVLGEIDRGHSAPADLAIDLVPIGQLGPKPRQDVGHGLEW